MRYPPSRSIGCGSTSTTTIRPKRLRCLLRRSGVGDDRSNPAPPAVARPAAVVDAGQAVGDASWQRATRRAYGVSCRKYSPRSDEGLDAACVDTIGTEVTNARAYACDDAWIVAAEPR